MAGVPGEGGPTGEQRDLGPVSSASARNWTSSVRASAAQASASERSASLSRPALSSTLARSVAHHAPLEVRGPSSGHRHQLQRARQVPGEELEEPEVVGCIKDQVGLAGLPGQTQAPAESALAALMCPRHAVQLTAVDQDLAWSTSGAASRPATARLSSASDVRT
jgi:hypothetical protein